MASFQNPQASQDDCPNAPSAEAIRTSESLIEPKQTARQWPRKPPVDFKELQARFG